MNSDFHLFTVLLVIHTAEEVAYYWNQQGPGEVFDSTNIDTFVSELILSNATDIQEQKKSKGINEEGQEDNNLKITQRWGQQPKKVVQ